MKYAEPTPRKRIPQKIRLMVYNKYDGRCAYCGKPITTRQLQIDHIIPLYDGGSDDVDNLLPACRDCNWVKMTWSVEKTKENITDYMRTLKRDVRYRMLLAYGLIEETPMR